jgi:hypothetical protein
MGKDVGCYILPHNGAWGVGLKKMHLYYDYPTNLLTLQGNRKDYGKKK